MAPGAHGMPRGDRPGGPRAGRCRGRRSARPPTRLADARARLADPACAGFGRMGAVPLALEPRRLAARQDFLRKLDRRGRGSATDLLLLLKVLTALGLRQDVRVATPSAPRRRAASPASRRRAPPAAPLGDLEPRGEGQDCDFAIVGSGAGGAVAAVVLAEAGLDVLVLEAGPVPATARYPTEPLTALQAPYCDGGLTFAEGLPGYPGASRAGGRRHDADQLRYLLPRPRRVALDAGAPSTGSVGARARGRLDDAEQMLHVKTPRSRQIGRNGQLLARAPSLGSPTIRSRGTPASVLSAAPALRAAGSTQSARWTSPTCRAPSRPEPGSAPVSRPAGSSSKAPGHRRSIAGAASRSDRRPPAPSGPYWSGRAAA